MASRSILVRRMNLHLFFPHLLVKRAVLTPDFACNPIHYLTLYQNGRIIRSTGAVMNGLRAACSRRGIHFHPLFQNAPLLSNSAHFLRIDSRRVVNAEQTTMSQGPFQSFTTTAGGSGKDASSPGKFNYAGPDVAFYLLTASVCTYIAILRSHTLLLSGDPAATPRDAEVRSWTVQDVAAWARNKFDALDAGIAKALEEEAIDGAVLVDLTDADLKEYGVKKVGHREHVLEAIAALNAVVRGTFTRPDVRACVR